MCRSSAWRRGPGLELIYRALAERDGVTVPEKFESAHVTEAAHDGQALALEAVNCFCGILGTFAGNIAVDAGRAGWDFHRRRGWC